jgi:hypothetical protein
LESESGLFLCEIGDRYQIIRLQIIYIKVHGIIEINSYNKGDSIIVIMLIPYEKRIQSFFDGACAPPPKVLRVIVHIR